MWQYVVLFVILYGIYAWKNRHIFLLSWKLSGPFAWPIIGNALTFLCKDEDLLDRLEAVMTVYPSPMRFWIGPTFAMIYTDVDQVEKFMNSSKFSYKHKLYEFQEPVLGKGLITGGGATYRADKKLIAPMLTGKTSEGYMHIFQGQAEKLIESLKETVGQPNFDIDLKINQCAHSILAATMAGYDPKAELGTMNLFLKIVHKMYIMVHSRILKVWMQTDAIYKLTSTGKDFEKNIETIHNVMKKWLQYSQENLDNKATKKEIDRDEEPAENVPIVHKLLKENNFRNEQEFIYQMTTLYVAGADTITAMSSFALVMLGMHQDSQKLVQEELDQVFGKTFRSVELSDLGEMPYLERCIKETLRLFPIAAFIMRRASEDVQVDDYFIPEGCGVCVGIHFIHRNAKHWEKPNEFYPDHFLPEAVKNRHPYAFIPFSVGSRGCIGKAYAYMALKTILATVLQKYQIEADGNMQTFKIKTDISIRPKNGYILRIKNRIRT